MDNLRAEVGRTYLQSSQLPFRDAYWVVKVVQVSPLCKRLLTYVLFLSSVSIVVDASENYSLG